MISKIFAKIFSRPVTAIALFVFAAALASCSLPFSENKTEEANTARLRGQLTSAAQKGDAKAQFDLGETYCCNSGEASGLIDNQVASQWLCRAAKGGYAPAMYSLGRLYAGDLLGGPSLGKAIKFFAKKADKATALMWLEVAISHGSEPAVADGLALRRQMTAAQTSRATRMLGDWRRQPCTWDKVFAG